MATEIAQTTPEAQAQHKGIVLTPIQKSAMLVVMLGSEGASAVFKNLDDREIETLTREVVRLPKLSPEAMDAFLEEVFESLAGYQYVSEGGSDYAKQVLSRALGTQRAGEMMARIAGARGLPFSFLAQIDSAQVIAYLETEHPQTVALILSHLPPDLSSRILSGLSYEFQGDVARRIALMDRTAPEVVREVEDALREKLAAFASTSFRTAGGIDYLVKVLGTVDARTERSILENLERNDPELAAEVKKRMFVFENVVQLDDRSIQRVLRDVNPKDLALALKGASEEVRDRILKNMSRRASQMLQEDIGVLGPVRLRLVEEAQAKIVTVIRTLQEAEEIVITRGAEEVLI
ncbi:MAG: flagellar motor switch protein FliG [Chloroflexi bacterium]|nr:flagellar motor switch protein FliG [Chloroflexota bacterium]